jgi:hypothetical protein
LHTTNGAPTLRQLDGIRPCSRWNAVSTGLRLIAVSVLALASSGCASLYVHSDSAQQATAKARDDLDKVTLSTVFDNEASYLDALRQRELASVAAQFSARRDADLIKILYGTGAGGLSGRDLLASRIDGYLKSIAGKSDRMSTEKLWRALDAALSSGNPTESFEADFAAQLAKISEAKEVVGISSPGGLTLTGILKSINSDEKALEQRDVDAKAAKEELAKALAAAGQSLGNDSSAQTKFADLAKRVNEFLANNNPYIRKYVSESLADSIGDLINATGSAGDAVPSNPKLKATLGFVQAALGVGDAFSNPPRVPHPNALAASKAWLLYVAGGADLEIAELKQNQALHEAELLAVTTQIYYLSRAGEELGKVSKEPLASTDGLARFLGGKTADRGSVSALSYYASAWTKGFIPAQQLQQVEVPNATRRAKLERSRQSADAWLGTLKPGVATLAAYGAGGIDPHILAEMLQALGLGAIAAGVNE